MMRIYKVLDRPNREPRLKNPKRPRGAAKRVARSKRHAPSGAPMA